MLRRHGSARGGGTSILGCDIFHTRLAGRCEYESLGISDPTGLRIFSRACATKTSRESAVSAAILIAREVMAELKCSRGRSASVLCRVGMSSKKKHDATRQPPIFPVT
jgi:hypothetical protein